MRYPVPPPMPREVRFDPDALYAAIDRHRRQLRISQREVLRQVGEKTPAALTRIGRGACPSADLLARLLHWLGDTDLRPFIVPIAPEDAGGRDTGEAATS